jgi:membrane fusion protein, multidrug efflux system
MEVGVHMSEAQSADMTRARRNRWIVGFVVALLVVVVFAHLLRSRKPKAGAEVQVVKVARAVRGDMPETLSELGTVTPIATVTVIPNQAVSGYLTEVPFREGQDVRKGQLLAQIDPRPYEVLKQQAQAQLAKDQAALDQARSDLARYEQLVQQKAIAEQIYVDQKFLVQQDEAAVKIDAANIAQYALDVTYCRITAPVAGRVGLRLVDPGNYITGASSTGLAVITTMKPTTVEFTVAQNDLDKVVEQFKAAGAKLPVTAFTSDNRSRLGTGTLYALGNQMATSTGTVTLRAAFPNDDEALYPNEFVNVQLLVETLSSAVLVPTPAVLSGAPGNYVYLVNKDNTVSIRKIALGPSDGKNTAILDGLSVGDTVVIEGTDMLSDGARIKIAASTGPAASPSPAPAHPAGKSGRSRPSQGS